MKRILYFVLVGCFVSLAGAQQLNLPNKESSFRFAVIGDTGTGESHQYQVADQLADFQKRFPFHIVVMMGDNLYGGQKPKDFERKFERPYKALLDQGVQFYAVLGNHDNTDQDSYKFFHMGGRRYFTFQPRSDIQFFGLDSNYMDKAQLDWFEKEIAKSKSDWKIVFFHHPLYSSGAAHGSDVELRAVLEPLFLKYQVSVVLSGHDHFYERIKPQRGIYYFVVGGSAKLREGNSRRLDFTEKAFDTDNSFMLMEIDKDTLHFQTISREGETVDSGSFQRPSDSAASASAVR